MSSKAGSTLGGKQQSGVQIDQAPTDPVHNYASCCPQDVLRLIFEVTVSDSRNPDTNLQQACRVASVCRAWRNAALNTPRIWNNICLRMGPNNDGLEEYWARTIERVKKVPVTVKISNICSRWSTKVLAMIHEASLPVDSLHLVLAHAGDINRFQDIVGEIPIEVNDLSVSFNGTVSSDRHIDRLVVQNTIDCGEIVKTVRCRRTLSLLGWGYCHSLTSSINTGLCSELRLKDVVQVDVAHLFLTFPSLETLSLSNCGLRLVSDVQPISRLRSLHIERCYITNLLTKMRFPALDYFSYLGRSLPEVNLFLKHHRTVTTLNFRDSILEGVPFYELAESASQVISLTIPAEWIYSFMGYQLTGERMFPSLRVLIIVDYPYIPVAQFEYFLKARCLPLSHHQSTAKSPSLVIDEFFIDFDKDDLRMRRMDEVVLYAEATKQVQPEYDSSRIRIKLSWPTA